MRRFAGVQQVLPVICTQRPVIVFTAAVYAREWFFMQQACQPVMACNPFHCLHNQLVVVRCLIAVIVYRCKLVLCGRNFIMLCLCGHTQLPKLYIQLMHKTGNSFLNTAKIMVVQLLAFRRGRAKQCPPCKNQIFPLVI